DIFGQFQNRTICSIYQLAAAKSKKHLDLSSGAFDLSFAFLFVLLTGLCRFIDSSDFAAPCNAAIASIGVDFSTMASIGGVPIGTTVASTMACFGRPSLCRVPFGIVGSRAGSDFSEVSREWPNLV